MEVYTSAQSDDVARAAISDLFATTAQAVSAQATDRLMNPVLVKNAILALSNSYRGCVVTKSGTQSIPSNTITAVTFDTESFDTDSIHSTSVNTSRMTVPSGVTKVTLRASVDFQQLNISDIYGAYLYKNGAALQAIHYAIQGASVTPVFTCSPVTVTCTAGDYFELFVYQNNGTPKTINNGTGFLTTFEMQAVG
jgi:hypothetical protein